MSVWCRRALSVCAVAGGLAAWALPAFYPGTALAAGLASGRTTAATGSQCQPLPAPAASPSASVSPTGSPASSAAPADLCVSVRASQSSVQPGKSASYTVTVWMQNGPASGVSVTLTAAPATTRPTFSDLCPSGDGSASCTIGSLATDVSPSSFQMQAQIGVPDGTAAGTAATLTATATTSTPMTTVPTAAASVTVSPARAPSHSPSPSGRALPSSASPSTLPTLPVTGVIPTLPTVPSPQSEITALVSPGSVASLLPVITPSAAPSGLASPAADVQSSPDRKNGGPDAGSFTLVMPAATAEILGGVILALVITLAITRLLATSRLTARAHPGTGNRAGRATANGLPTKASLIRRLRHPLAARPRPQPGKPGTDGSNKGRRGRRRTGPEPTKGT